jgi:hypothetical protein
MRNVGPKNITRSLLEDKPRKRKKKLEGDDLTFRVLARKDPEDLSDDERRELKDLRKKRKERKKKRELETMEQAERNDRDYEAEKKGLKRKETKLSKSRDLVVSVGAGNLSTKERKALERQAESYFGANSVKIMDMLENGDADSGITVLKKTLLMTIIRVLPMAEDILTNSGTAKGTYQFVTLISQMRELMADIQADKDKQFLAQSIAEQIIRPAFMNMAQEMMMQHHTFRKKGDLFVVPSKNSYFSEQLLELGKNLAAMMQTEYKEVSTKIQEALKN